MKTGLAHTLIALIVTGTVAAGYGNAPATPGPRQANPAGTTPLSVTLDCGWYNPPILYCRATVSGGSYPYSFTWPEESLMLYENDNESWARVVCSSTPMFVEVTVTDSNAATASGYASLNCY
ncbi:MAG TPA: hypothetical protein VF705_04280 [Longimicrobium sp.]|jgi:hypothetical protein